MTRLESSVGSCDSMVKPMRFSDEGTGNTTIYCYDGTCPKTCSDCVVSCIDRFLEANRSGCKHLLINMDNCAVNKSYTVKSLLSLRSSAEKNTFWGIHRFPDFSQFQVIGYFAFLIAHRFFDSVTAHYLVSGHTHFTPDRAFGWLSGRLKNRDIFDPRDVVQLLNHPVIAVRYSGEELRPRDFDRWEDLVGSIFSRLRGIKSWHWIRVRLDDSEVPIVILEAMVTSSQNELSYSRTQPVSAFPDMTVEAYEPIELSERVIGNLKFASAHIGSRTFRYLSQEGS